MILSLLLKPNFIQFGIKIDENWDLLFLEQILISSITTGVKLSSHYEHPLK